MREEHPRIPLRKRASTWSLILLAAFFFIGCVPQEKREVVVYTALDEPFSQPVFDEFTRQTGIAVRAKFDTESTKTVGLTQAILAERARPRCDLFWNNEVVNTLRLDQAELLQAYAAKNANAFPAQYRSPQHTWHGLAARARVLLVNTELIPKEERPTTILALADPKWKARCGIAKPLAGTTATHAACLFAAWGEDRAKEYLSQVAANAKILSGNKQVALAVGSGQIAFGLTDTDDALIELSAGKPVTIVYPDQGNEEVGTLFIPNTIALVKGAPHQEDAQRLVEFLLTPKVEEMLAEGASAQIPLNPAVRNSPRVESPQTVRAMEVDFQKAAQQWDAAAEFLRDEFTTK
ncbi:extracellular solute-binding protein [Adhaeretor mobilis]|uniref:Putative binding protein component of ABC iron transporter n=1 Tax=Adhaeretor mobilis TaxID=1930276 RepID=A0A517N1X0_9BACT|nr:extracellular solute-binding protein [Adhaeretor mobilis]QDT01131.1 putative binding protein component of ABC iron transporter precursor [Adhaeretor mobilis]